MNYRILEKAGTAGAGMASIEVDLDDRVAPRFTLLIRPAKLITGRAEFLCVIRDVSATGVSVRLFHPLTGAGVMTLELQSGERHAVSVVWQDESEAGFQFAAPIDVEAFIRHSSRFPKRALRFCAEAPVSLMLPGGTRQTATLKNISQQGAMIECDAQIALDQILKLESSLLPDIEARVRWRAQGRYGLVFDTTFGMPAMAAITSRLHDGSSQAQSMQHSQPGTPSDEKN